LNDDTLKAEATSAFGLLYRKNRRYTTAIEHFAMSMKLDPNKKMYETYMNEITKEMEIEKEKLEKKQQEEFAKTF
jgi:hypothetical protein